MFITIITPKMVIKKVFIFFITFTPNFLKFIRLIYYHIQYD
ncbi:protein of unknown function [Oenococcus oeni]|nr:hypothetical protein OENI_110030 [Oenococcus oeni]SYW01054.1 hypothetical protein OENI_30232 [Oenococcus oeni]SYW02500.1 hypothetical protein OENI_370025 [Oenococcus oeni]SYW08379.1 hypothetical protein OENI_240005 [Oenococcus oeni]SYW14458.1 hypothetical protein OENI_500002 [Oenococcus oeni]